LLALGALAFIVVTGGAVRVTGSGLGCPDWPTCDESRIVAPLEYHAMVEFVNRTITGLVSVAVMLAVLGSLARVPRRRDLVWLSWGLVVGVLAQIGLGGLTVLFELSPPFVMGHFLLSMVLLWNAVVLHERAGVPDDAPEADFGHAFAPQRFKNVPKSRGWALVVFGGLAIVAGTVVTASGPHGGDPDVERLPFALDEITRTHGVTVWALFGLTLDLVVRLWRTGERGPVWRRSLVLLALVIVQAAVGYTQYVLELPALLVGIHIAGATAVWIAVVRLHAVFVGISPPWSPPPKPQSKWTSPVSTTSPSPTAPGS